MGFFLLGRRGFECAAINGFHKRAGGAHRPAALIWERLGGKQAQGLQHISSSQVRSGGLGAGG